MNKKIFFGGGGRVGRRKGIGSLAPLAPTFLPPVHRQVMSSRGIVFHIPVKPSFLSTWCLCTQESKFVKLPEMIYIANFFLLTRNHKDYKCHVSQ